MQDVLQRAWEETKRFYGLSWGMALRTMPPVLVGFGLVWLVLGQSEAKNEATFYVLYLLAVICAGFVPLFLWNLWLAPYQIVKERLDELATAHEAPRAIDENRTRWGELAARREEVLDDMNNLLWSIEARLRRKFDSPGSRDPEDFDHTFLTLIEKHQSWLPKGVPDSDLKPWVGRIIATLEALDYPASKQRIERAVDQGTWIEETR